MYQTFGDIVLIVVNRELQHIGGIILYELVARQHLHGGLVRGVGRSSLLGGVGSGGGGGSALPTITSTFKDATVEKGQDVDIPIFFSSPNMGSGTAYILVNNVQVDSSGVSQGNNVITIKATHLANKT